MTASEHVRNVAGEAYDAENKQLWQDLQRIEELIAEGEGGVRVDGYHLQYYDEQSEE